VAAGVSVSEFNPYKILQVDPEAEDEVIEAAYRRLARKYHPDISPSRESQDRMVLFNQAWEQLRDPMRRAAVDRARTRAAGSVARAAAADAQARTANQPPPSTTRHTAQGPDQRRTNVAVGPVPGSAPPAGGWGFGGMSEQQPAPGFEAASAPRAPGGTSAAVPYDATSIRQATGATTRPPPGNPSGSVVTFGRFSGWTLGEIARVEPEYLEWLDRMPIGRMYQAEIDSLLRASGHRTASAHVVTESRGLFRRR
jgi:curved DNA-binding protein CbpA